MNPVAELSAALASRGALSQWLAARGWGRNPEPPPVSPRRSLANAVHLVPTTHLDAPNVLFLWEDTLTERAADGAGLRLLQREMNSYADALRERPDVPALALVGSPELLLSFPLQGDPFARRLRFTPKRLARPASPLVLHFQRFHAETMAAWIVRPNEDSLFSTGAPSWSFTDLFVGAALDQGFVDFMTWQRRDLTRRVLSAPDLLDDMLGRLREPGQPRQPAAALPHDRPQGCTNQAPSGFRDGRASRSDRRTWCGATGPSVPPHRRAR